MTNPIDGEIQAHRGNPFDFDGFEFIEHTTARPQAHIRMLEMMGFDPSAKHRFEIVHFINAIARTNGPVYREVFGFVELSDDKHFGVMPYGRILSNPCTSLYLQLVDPAPTVIDFESEEVMAQRTGTTVVFGMAT